MNIHYNKSNFSIQTFQRESALTSGISILDIFRFCAKQAGTGSPLRFVLLFTETGKVWELLVLVLGEQIIGI